MLALASVVACVVIGTPWLLLAWLVPDLGVLAGGLRVVEAPGRLTPRAAVGYNVLHTPWAPVALGVLAAALSAPVLWPVVALWLSHIAADRALGYRLKPVHG